MKYIFIAIDFIMLVTIFVIGINGRRGYWLFRKCDKCKKRSFLVKETLDEVLRKHIVGMSVNFKANSVRCKRCLKALKLKQ